MLRSRHRIIADILNIASEPVNSTTIIYGVSLSNEQFKLYMSLLQNRMLIERKDNMWLVTDKGRAYVLAYSRLLEIFGAESAVPAALVSTTQRYHQSK